MQLVQHLGRFAAQMLPKPGFLVQPTKNVLLHVVHHVTLPQIVQTNFAKARKHLGDALALFARRANQE